MPLLKRRANLRISIGLAGVQLDALGAGRPFSVGGCLQSATCAHLKHSGARKSCINTCQPNEPECERQIRLTKKISTIAVRSRDDRQMLLRRHVDLSILFVVSNGAQNGTDHDISIMNDLRQNKYLPDILVTDSLIYINFPVK